MYAYTAILAKPKMAALLAFFIALRSTPLIIRILMRTPIKLERRGAAIAGLLTARMMKMTMDSRTVLPGEDAGETALAMRMM